MSTRANNDYAGGPYVRTVLLVSALGLTLFGLVMIYSASSIMALEKDGSSWLYLAKQLVFIAAGWGGALVLGRFDYRRLKEVSLWIWGGTIALLFTVLVIGRASHGAQRWIPLGLFNLQPSELAKVACVIAISAVAVQWQRGKLSTREFLTKTALITGIPAVLIIAQPDMGTTATLIVAVVLVLVLAGINLGWVFTSGAGLVALAAVFIMSSDYRRERVHGFLDPWADPAGKGYQTIQALYAFGSGGLDGVGLGFSRQKFFYLPEAHTDFILAIVGEELGLIGTLAVLAGFVVFTWAGFKIASGARDEFGRLLAGGLTGMIAFQAIVNMAAVTGMMPVTGKPLPFVSYGGSSMIVTALALGLLLSVSRYGMLAPRAVRVAASGESGTGSRSVSEGRKPGAAAKTGRRGKSERRVEERVVESTRHRRRDSGAHLSRTGGCRKTARRA